MNCGGLFDVDKKQEEIKNLEDEMNSVDFWNNKSKADEVISNMIHSMYVMELETSLVNQRLAFNSPFYVSDMEAYRNIAFFHHLIFTKA